mgnify:CR=1 FL=1
MRSATRAAAGALMPIRDISLSRVVAPIFGEHFAKARPAATAVICGLVDERMTTVSAEAMLRDRGRKGIVRAGRDPSITGPFINPPVIHASTVLFDSTDAMFDRSQRYTYGRRGTPTSEALESAISGIEGAAALMVEVASG